MKQKEDPDPLKKKKKEGTLQKFMKKMQITCMGKKTQLTSGFPTSNGRGWAALTKVEGKTAVETITPSQDSVQRQRQRTVT